MKILPSILIVILILSSLGCENDFNPFGEARDVYAVTCILKGDSYNQVATLSHLYNVDGYDPYMNRTDPSIINAEVRVWVGDSVYLFRDTSVTRTDTSRYTTPFHFYSSSNFSVVPNENLEVEVLFKSGRRLKAKSKSPKEIYFDNENDQIIPSGVSDLIRFGWNLQADPIFFAPRLTIRYLQNINGNQVEKIKIVPLKYVNQNGNLTPIFPKASTKISVFYELDAFNSAMQEISEGDSNKSNYSIFQKQVFTVIAFDLNLSRYASSTDQSFDDLTVTMDESDYTNIEGGLGIFGCYTKEDFKELELQKDYVKSFGYLYRVGE